MKKLSLVNPFGASLFYEDTVSSTMDVSRILAERGEPHGTVIIADFQNAGRGRIGRTWTAHKGENLFFTILLRYAGYAVMPKVLTLKTGLAVSLAIEDFVKNRGLSLRESVQVKWPNDIMIGSRKAVGILTEGNSGVVYIGIGVNLAQTQFPQALREKATSIALGCDEKSSNIRSEDRFPLLETILAELYQIITVPDDDQWRTQLLDRLYMRNKPVRFIPGPPDSTVSIEGVLRGIGPQGELLIVLEGETKPVSCIAGELDVYR
ncbi:MAG: biotin--[acetyl-CoA-carboxylase] ligase [Treponema sp.]|jgi:BirA family biotin operon repressor/biotin-[acetyl-CoA-carboxylase] ligase|nr:biotin--[acetyl-CoA-carboxylase] ligase [Treponema sp.]